MEKDDTRAILMYGFSKDTLFSSNDCTSNRLGEKHDADRIASSSTSSRLLIPPRYVSRRTYMCFLMGSHCRVSEATEIEGIHREVAVGDMPIELKLSDVSHGRSLDVRSFARSHYFCLRKSNVYWKMRNERA